jgi:hypothetical protein
LIIAGAVTTVVLARNFSVASCLTGTWRAHSHVTTLVTNGSTTTNTITGLRVEIRDGTAQHDYNRAMARLDGELVELSGTVTYDFRVDGRTIVYTNGRTRDSSGESREQDYAENVDCAGDRLTLTGAAGHASSRAEWTIKLNRE